MLIKPAFFRPFLISRMFLGKPVATDIAVCENCGFEYSTHRPNEEQMRRQYAAYMGEEYLCERERFEPGFRAQIQARVHSESLRDRQQNLLACIKPFIGFNGVQLRTILDYGGGGGEIIPPELHCAKCFVFDISNKEPVENVAKIQNEAELLNQRFDLIICSHMLEHVSYPMEFIHKFIKLMHKDSLLYLEVPYAEFGWREDDQGNSLVHEHINMFKKETFMAIGKMLGLEILVCEIFTTPKRFACPKSIRALARLKQPEQPK